MHSTDLAIALTAYSRELAFAIHFRNLARCESDKLNSFTLSDGQTLRAQRLAVMRGSAKSVRNWRAAILSAATVSPSL